MVINGRLLASQILDESKTKVDNLIHSGIYPRLAVILIGDNPSSLSYIRQKEKAAKIIGANIELIHYAKTYTVGQIQKTIATLNTDPKIHGIIIQRPVPTVIKSSNIVNLVNPQKDVDGFVPNSPFSPPVALAVERVLNSIYKIQNSNPKSQIKSKYQKLNSKQYFYNWLIGQKITVVGRGETAGMPIFNFLQKIKNNYQISNSPAERDPRSSNPDKIGKLDRDKSQINYNNSKSMSDVSEKLIQLNSTTPNPDQIIKQSDIVISCVGKDRIIRKDNIKPGSIVISVGMWKDNYGKIQGDYQTDEIKDIAGYCTPTPGGIGPVNVAYLMRNLITAATKLYSKS